METVNTQPNFAVAEQQSSSVVTTEKKKRHFYFSFGIGYSYKGKRTDLFKLQIKKT